MDTSKPARLLKSITSSLLSLVECPVCLETTQVPIKQCATGHVLCSRCTVDLKGCPLCQQPFTIENPIGFKQLLEALPRFCKYADVGCPEVVGCDDNHEIYCGHRPITCLKLNCSEKIKVCDLLKHFETKHKNTDIFQNNTSIFIKNPLDYYTGKFVTCNTPIYVFEHFCWLAEENDVEQKQLKIAFNVAHIAEPTEDFFIVVEFVGGGDFKYENTIKAVNYYCEYPIEIVTYDVLSMSVPHSLLAEFINECEIEIKIKSFKRAK